MAGSCVTRLGRLSATGGDQREPHGAHDRLDEGDLVFGQGRLVVGGPLPERHHRETRQGRFGRLKPNRL